MQGPTNERSSITRIIEQQKNKFLSEKRALKKKDVLRIVTVAWDLQLVSVYVCPGEAEPCEI